jgi:hypothetical protein
MRSRASWASVGLALGVAAFAVASIGCEAPAVPERRALTTAKLLVPDPTMTVKATSATRKTLGIAEWRLYRGKGGVHLTGYNNKGKAVKGLSTVFTRQPDGSIASLLARINDGSHFIVGHSVTMHTTLPTKAIAPDSQAFVRRAALDLSLWQRLAQSQAHGPLTKTAALQAACSVQLPATVLQSIVCLDAQTGAALPPGICRVDPLANQACLGLDAARGINGGFGTLDVLDGTCAPGDSRCSAIAFENTLDSECEGGISCVGGRGGWVPLFEGDFSEGGGTTGRAGVPDFFDPNVAGGADDFGLGTQTQRERDGVSPDNPFGTGGSGPQDVPRFEDFRRSDNIDDRRDFDDSSSRLLQPDDPGPDHSGSDLAKQAGIDDIGYSSQSSSSDNGAMSYDSMNGAGGYSTEYSNPEATGLADGTAPL